MQTKLPHPKIKVDICPSQKLRRQFKKKLAKNKTIFKLSLVQVC